MTALVTVIPLPHKELKSIARTAASPEPVQLYGLIVIALLLHVPATEQAGELCCVCAQAWPCPQVRLACRLLDGL
jgi:hypothetical protein